MKLSSAYSGAWIAVLAAATDRVSKVLAERMDPAQVISLIPGVIRLRRTVNTGMAFSMFSGQTLMLTLVSALLVAGLIAWMIVRPNLSRLLRTGLWLVVGGGLGNLWDRIV